MAVPRVSLAGQSIPAYAKTVGRAVHVKIYPRPRNLAESREVLRVLQQYGEIVSYRHLKHDPDRPAANSAWAVYQNANSAQSIINASPLRFESGNVGSSTSVSQFMPPTPPSAKEEEVEEVEDSDPTPQDTSSDSAQEEFDEVNTARQRPAEASGERTAFTPLGGTARWGKMRAALNTEQAPATTPSPSEPPKTFTPNPTSLKASAADLPNPPSSTEQTPTSSSYTPGEFHLTIESSFLNHHSYIQRQHYYGPFRLDLKTLMGNDLRDRVPVAGMADCQPWKREVPLRIRLKRRQEEENDEWISLGSVWEEGEREREMERQREKERERHEEKEWERKMERWRETETMRMRKVNTG